MNIDLVEHRKVVKKSQQYILLYVCLRGEHYLKTTLAVCAEFADINYKLMRTNI